MHLRLCWRLCFLVESRVPFTRPASTKKYKSNFKIGPMTLFTHLKIIIILLQCLQLHLGPPFVRVGTPSH